MNTTYTFRLSEGLKKKAHKKALKSGTELSKVLVVFLEKFTEGKIEFVQPDINTKALNAIADAETEAYLRSR